MAIGRKLVFFSLFLGTVTSFSHTGPEEDSDERSERNPEKKNNKEII